MFCLKVMEFLFITKMTAFIPYAGTASGTTNMVHHYFARNLVINRECLNEPIKLMKEMLLVLVHAKKMIQIYLSALAVAVHIK